ncbi:hypothetical protein D3C80_1333840 [compost metagenome]
MRKGMLVAGRHGSAERQVLGNRRQAGNYHQRVIGGRLDGPLDGGFSVATENIVEAQYIGEEQHVEVGLVGDTRLIGPELERVGGQTLIRGVGPETGRSTTADTGLLVEGKQEGFRVRHHRSCKR